MTVSEKQVVSRLKNQLPLGVDLEVVRKYSWILSDRRVKKNRYTVNDLSSKVTGNDPKPVTTTGATYARKMPNILAFGPSFPGQKGIAHTANEYGFRRFKNKFRNLHAQPQSINRIKHSDSTNN